MLNRYLTLYITTCIILANSIYTAKAGKYYYKPKDLQATILEVTVLQSSLQNQRKGFAEKELETRNQKVSLNYRDKFFQIEFSAINAIDTNRTVFRYKLKGLDEE